MTEYKTFNLDFAAYLKCLGISFLRVEPDPDNLKRKFLVFEDTGNIEKLRQAYIKGDATVEPAQYFQAIKWIKTFIYNPL